MAFGGILALTHRRYRIHAGKKSDEWKVSAADKKTDFGGGRKIIMMRFILPLRFCFCAATTYVGLGLNPREVPSPLIGKAAPLFTLQQESHEPDKKFCAKDMLSTRLLNVWSSWCVSCREERPVLVELSKQHIVPIYGLDYKDHKEDAEAWLQRGGDPYDLSVMDTDGRVGINYGVYGVPETYVIDKQGIIQYKEIGPVWPKKKQSKILPLIAQLQAK